MSALQQLSSELHAGRSPKRTLELIWGTLSAIDAHIGVDLLRVHPDFNSIRRTISTSWKIALASVESTQSQTLGRPDDGRDSHWPSVLAVEKYSGLDEEIAMLGGPRFDNLCVVGCGPFPEIHNSTSVAICRVQALGC